MVLIAVDAGGTWIKAARFGRDLRITARVKQASGAGAGMDAYWRGIGEAVKRCQVGNKPLVVGLAIPGVLSRDRRTLHYSPNVAGSRSTDPGVVMAERVRREVSAVKAVVADNDAKCAAVGEWASGHGGGDLEAVLLHLTWGTGIGTGLIVQGIAQYGWEGGHLPVRDTDGDEQCNCGSRRDLESHIAVPRLVKRARRWWEEKRYATTLAAADFSDARETPRILSEKARSGDELASTLLKDALTSMARALHALAVVGFPTIVTVGGAMMDSDWLLAELRTAVRREAHGLLKTTLTPAMVHRAKLGNEAGLLGAAALARQADKKKSPGA